MDSINSSDQNTQKKRKLQMEELSYNADIKRAKRERENILLEVKRYENEVQRLLVTISDAKASEKKIAQKEQFLQEQISAIKKKLINLERQ